MANLKERLAAELHKAFSVFNDVTLQGSDGVQVLASKALLAERSNYLYHLFYGAGRHFLPNGTQINWYVSDVPSRVLRALVEYCYTDSTLLWMPNTSELSDEMAVNLVQLLMIGGGWGIPQLYKDSWTSLEMQLSSHPGCICAVMEEMLVRGCMDKIPDEYYSDTRSLWGFCFELIDDKPSESLLPKAHCNQGVRGCSFRLLEMIFQTMGKLLHPMIAIKVLREWNRSCQVIMDNEKRKKLQKLADSVDLNDLSLAELCYLEPCNLFSRQRIVTIRSVKYGVKKELVENLLDPYKTQVIVPNLSQANGNCVQKQGDDTQKRNTIEYTGRNLALDERNRKRQKIGEV